VGRHVLNSSTTAACRICSTFWAFQNHRSLRYRTQGVIMLSRARYSWPGSNYPVMLDDCSAGPPPSAASAAEASLPDPRSTRASFLSGVSPLPGSRPRLSMYAAPDMGPFSGAYAAGFVSLAEKSSLEKNPGPFCCHKNTSFCMTCIYIHTSSPSQERLFFWPAFVTRLLPPRSRKSGYGLLLGCRSGFDRGREKKTFF